MRIVSVAVDALALLVAALLIPGFVIEWADDAIGIVILLLALAIVFGLVNASLKPIARLVSLPFNIATLGLFSVFLNAALLLGVAFVVDLIWRPVIVIGGYPPDLSAEAVITAAAGAFVISAVSTAMDLLIPDA